MYLCCVLRISTHIEQLLLVNDCVIIPDFGGFILQNCPAVYVAPEYTFYPPRKEIRFNPALNHNDGLLSESYMQTYGMTFREAQYALKKEVDDLKAELEKKGRISLGSIGSFRKGEEGGYLFLPGANTSLFSVNSYGLDTFHLSPVQTAVSTNTAKPDRETGRVVHLPLRRVAFRIAGMVAAAIALFLLISPPVKDVSQTAYTAGFNLSEIVSKQTTPTEQSVSITQTPDTIVQAPDTVTTKTIPALPDTTVTQSVAAASQQQPAVSGQPKTYYVIIGSFRTEKQAEKYIADINTSEYKEIGTVKQNENIRVYVAGYDNRKEAEACLLLLRANEKFKDAWLYISQ
jgi:cell division septation protein DedD